MTYHYAHTSSESLIALTMTLSEYKQITHAMFCAEGALLAAQDSHRRTYGLDSGPVHSLQRYIDQLQAATELVVEAKYASPPACSQ